MFLIVVSKLYLKNYSFKIEIETKQLVTSLVLDRYQILSRAFTTLRSACFSVTFLSILVTFYSHLAQYFDIKPEHMSAVVIKRSNNGFWPQLRNLTRPAPTRKVREGHFFLRKMSKGPSSSTSSSWTPTGSNPSFLSKPWMSMFVNSFSSAGPKDKFTVCVEGNIASGKTSLLQHFESNPNTEVCMEPVDKWRNVQGHNTLALMYEDPKRWSLTLQTYVQLTMIQRHLREQKQQVKLMERSIFSAKYCFVENLHNGGVMPDAEFVVLSEWFDWLISYHNVQVDLIVYLRADPEVVHRRIKNRCRNEEAAIPLDYLQSLHTLHEDWLVKKPSLFPCPAPVLVLDANQDLPEMLKLYDEKKTEILCGCT